MANKKKKIMDEDKVWEIILLNRLIPCTECPNRHNLTELGNLCIYDNPLGTPLEKSHKCQKSLCKKKPVNINA